jgi:hypothetical protein
MIPSSASKLAWIIGTAALAVITVITLGPAQWVVLRTGVGWLLDHFLGYFCLTVLICSVYRRPILVAIALMVLAGLLEALQGLTIDRKPDLLSALSGAGGVLTAALLVWALISCPKDYLRPYLNNHGEAAPPRQSFPYSHEAF